MRRTLLLCATWTAGTVLAVLVAWRAVSFVSAEVTEERGAPISDRDVAEALAAPQGRDGAGTTTTVLPGGGAGPPSSAPANTASTAATRPSAGTPTTLPRSATTTDATSATPTTSTSTPGSTAPAPAPTTTTIDSQGGQVAVRYDAGRVELLWATSQDGFEADVRNSGPDLVEVRFESAGHESRIRAFWRDGRPAHDVDENGG